MNDIVTRLNRILSGAQERGLDETECRAILDAVAEIGQLRREVCELRCNPSERFIGLPHELAEINGWDCYKENTND